MNTKDLKLKLIKKIVDADDNRLSIIDELINLDIDKWLLFNEFFNDRTRGQLELYKLIKSKRMLVATRNDISIADIKMIERYLIGGELLEQGIDNKDVAQKLFLLKDFSSDRAAEKEVAVIKNIIDFTNIYPLAKKVFLKGIIAPSTLEKCIINYEYQCQYNIELYLKELLTFYNYFILEDDEFNIPRRSKNSNLLEKIKQNEIEQFNIDNPKWNMPTTFKKAKI